MIVDISVVVAAFNEEVFIGRCLRSLLSQTLSTTKFEVIVVDDASTDRTAYALSQFVSPSDEKVRVLTNDKNMGLPASLNRAIHAASGKYVVRVDADDFVNQNFLSFLFTYLEMNGRADAVSCDYLLVSENEDIISHVNSADEPIACGVMFQRQHLLEIGLYDELFRSNEEKDLRLRFETKYSISRLDIPLYRYRRHQNNMTDDLVSMAKYGQMLAHKHKK